MSRQRRLDWFRWAFRMLRPCYRRVRCFSRCRRLNRLSDCRCQHPIQSLRTRNWSDHPTGLDRAPLLLLLALLQLHPENRAAPPPVLQQPAGPTLSLVRRSGASGGCGRARGRNHRAATTFLGDFLSHSDDFIVCSFSFYSLLLFFYEKKKTTGNSNRSTAAGHHTIVVFCCGGL